MRELLQVRGFRRFFVAQAASQLGDAIFPVALAFAVLETTGSATQLGTVLAIGSAVLVASFLVSGVWADRLPRVRLMVVCDVVRVATQLTLAGLLATDRATLPLIAVLYAISQVASAFFTPARTGLIPQLLEPHHLIRANGMLTSSSNTLAIAGFAGGGLLVAVAGPAGAIAIDAATFAVSGLLLIGVRPLIEVVQSARLPFRREFSDGWNEVRSRRWLWYIIVLASLFLLLCEAPIGVVGPVVSKEHYAGAATWGLLASAIAVGAVIGSQLASRTRAERPMVVAMTLFYAAVVAPLLLMLHVPVWVLLPVNVVVGMSHGMFDTLWQGTVQREIPPERLARVSAFDWMGSMALMPIGFALAGFAVGGVGTTPVLIGISVSAFVICTLMLMDRDARDVARRMPVDERP